MKPTLTLLTVLLLAPLALVHAADRFIVEDGQPRAAIVVAEKPTRSAKLAAGELQAFVEKISGGRLPIVTVSAGDLPVIIYVGESEPARRAGVDAEGLERDAFRVASGPDWLALVGRDWDFTPVEPWARNHGDWQKNREAEWLSLAGHPWRNPVAASLYKDYNKTLDIWNLDHRGTLNAVYAFLRDLGVRWYQIVINPDGRVSDLDRGVAKARWQDWSSQAEVAVSRDGASWSAEIRLPVTASDEDPLHEIMGSMPFKVSEKDQQSGKGANLPWHFNLWRKLAGSPAETISVFSPPDPETKDLHDTLRFAEIYVR